MIDHLNTGNYNVTGLILISSDLLISNMTYGHPKIISLAKQSVALKLKELTYKLRPDLTMELSHTFVKKCFLIENLKSLYSSFGIIWALILASFYIHTFIICR